MRDGNAFWLSSGNWQSSNQPDVHPFDPGAEKLPAGFQRKYNRDYHAIIANDTLAAIYETYIKRDYKLASEQAQGAVPFALPDLFVPEEEEEPELAVTFAAPPQLFKPLTAQAAREGAAASDAGQLCRKCADPDPLGQEERVVPEPVHQFPRHGRRTSPSSDRW